MSIFRKRKNRSEGVSQMYCFVPANSQHRTYAKSGSCSKDIEFQDDNTSLNKPKDIDDNVIIKGDKTQSQPQLLVTSLNMAGLDIEKMTLWDITIPPRHKGDTSENEDKRASDTFDYIDNINDVIIPLEDPWEIKSENDSKRNSDAQDYIDITNYGITPPNDPSDDDTKRNSEAQDYINITNEGITPLNDPSDDDSKRNSDAQDYIDITNDGITPPNDPSDDDTKRNSEAQDYINITNEGITPPNDPSDDDSKRNSDTEDYIDI